ncbi:MAG: hypothetical protein ACYCUF_07735 [Acidimicrobiales bacterium]|jgi:hypothetical protein
MGRSPLLKYWPLAAIIGIQALVITIAPSTAPSATGASGVSGYSAAGPYGSNGSGTYGSSASQGANGSNATAGASLGTSGASGTTFGGGGTSTGGTSTGGGGTSTGGSGPSTGPGTTTPGVGVGNSTTHCVNGREFNPAIAWFAPPCTPGSIGVSDPSNGGSTWEGVSSNSITVVDYISNYGAEVNAILQAEGQLVTYSEAQAWDKVIQHFINTHFVLYGRKVHIITYQGQCTSVPPDYACLIPEMDRIVATYHPYMVQWITTLCSACYAELARQHVVAVGGQGFSDAFANAQAPYYYSATESSTRMETAFAQWWCNQMSSVNDPSRRVKFAGTSNPAQNFNGQPRRLGVISTNDPDNEATVKNVLEPALAHYCGDKVWHTYFYSQNINTAAEQVAAGIAAMDTPTNPANVVLCLCDTVAPQFLYQGEASNNYWPENLVADTESMTLDATSQNYDSGPACPSSNNCEYWNAFGLTPTAAQEPMGNDVGLRIWQAGGGSGNPPLGSNVNAGAWAEQYIMWASLIENTGPDLTPANMQARAPGLGAIGGGNTGHPLLQLAPGDWQWTQDTRVAYWAHGINSSYNGKPGTFVQIEGTRFNLGQYPSEPGGPPIPIPRP